MPEDRSTTSTQPPSAAEPVEPTDPTEAEVTEPAGDSGTSGPGAPADGRDRLVSSLRRPGSRGQLVVAGLLAILGFAAVTQVKANDRDDQYIGARQGDLIQYITSLSLASKRTEDEIAKLEQTRTSLRSDTAARQTALERARQQADTLGILAGTVPATGPGIRIEVTGSKNGSSKGAVVGSDQLLNGLEELRDAGAEVIELNDKVRVVAQTSVRDTPDGSVLADGKVIRAPFVIEAIGDPHTLATALDISGGFIASVEDLGGQVSVKQLDKVDVGSVVEPPKPDYAQPGPTG